MRPAGTISPCCENHQDIEFSKNEKDIDLNLVLNSPKMNDMRKKMLKGQKIPSCEFCYKVEAGGGRSYRQNASRWLHKVDVLKPQIKYLEVALDTTCNLTCRTCSSMSSSKWIPGDKKLKRYFQSTKRKSFAVDDLKIDYGSIFKFRILGGEPMIMKSVADLHKKISEGCHLDEVELEYSTNLTVFPSEDTLNLWRKVRQVNLIGSLDGYGPLNDYIRKGSEWEVIVGNLDKLYAFFKNEMPSTSEFTIHTTVSIYNIGQIVELDNWLADRYPKATLNKLCLIEPDFLSIVNLPNTLKLKYKEILEARPDRPQYLHLIDFLEKNSNLLWRAVRVFHKNLQRLWNDSLEEIDPELWHWLDGEIEFEPHFSQGQLPMKWIAKS